MGCFWKCTLCDCWLTFSLCGQPTIDEKYPSGAEGGFIGGQMDDQLRHLLGCCDAPERMHRLLLLELLLAQRLQHRGPYDAGTDRVDANLRFGVIERHAPHQADDRVFGHVVCDLTHLANYCRS